MSKTMAYKFAGLCAVLALGLSACGTGGNTSEGGKAASSEKSDAGGSQVVVDYTESSYSDNIAFTADGAAYLVKDGKVGDKVADAGEVVKHSSALQDVAFLTKSGDIKVLGLFLGSPDKETGLRVAKSGLKTDDIVDLQVGGNGSVAYLDKDGGLFVYEVQQNHKQSILSKDDVSSTSDPKFVQVAEGVTRFALEAYTIRYLKKDSSMYHYSHASTSKNEQNGEDKDMDDVKDIRLTGVVETVGLRNDGTAFIVGGSNIAENFIFEAPGKYDEFTSLIDGEENFTSSRVALKNSEGLFVVGGSAVDKIMTEVGKFKRVDEDGNSTTLFSFDLAALEKATGAKGVSSWEAEKGELNFVDSNYQIYKFADGKGEKVGDRTLDNIGDWFKEQK